MKAFIFLTIFFLFCIGIYGATLKGMWGNPLPTDFKGKLDQATKPFELSPERDRYALVMSLVHDHRFNLSPVLAEAAYPDTGYYQGRYYIYFAPGISLLAAPLYMLGERYELAQVASFSVAVIFALGAQFFLYKIARNIFKLPASLSIFAALLYAFCSTSWSYAVTLYQHQTTAFLILSAFYAAWHFKERKAASWLAGFYVWLAFAVGLLIDYPNGFFFLPIMIYFFLSAFNVQKVENHLRLSVRLAFFFSSVGFVALTLWHGYYNATNFGSWHSLSGTLVGVKTIQEKKLDTTGSDQTAIEDLAKKKNVVKFFSEEKSVFGFYTLFFSLDRGLFLYSPIFVLAVFGFFKFLKYPHAEVSTLLGTLGCIVFLYSSWGDPWGGWAFGPRYLIPALPILALLVSVWIYGQKWQWLRKILAFLLCAYSSAVALVGVLTTNAIPPKVEADFLQTGYNFLLNWQYFEKGRTSSFVYNTYLSQTLPLWQYFAIVYGVVLFLIIFILCIVPRFERHDD